jgi:ribulose-phosphate 3-epimerase
MIRLAPSILSADFSRIGEAVQMLEEAGADWIHIDVMDGHFVPNLTLGPQAVSALKKITSLPLDVHLMVSDPGFFIPVFREAGADWISVHVEASSRLHREVALIKELKAKAGVALNPATPIHFLSEILQDLDYVLVMSVNPGFGGQKFIEASRRKIRQLSHWIKGQKLDIAVEVDGGVGPSNADALIEDGAEILVVGSAIYKDENPPQAVATLKKIIEQHNEK